MARSLNKAQLIGNLTRDPELRYTPSGAAVCTFGIATNRSWTTDTGEKHEESEFHNIVAWNKLAELCSQFLVKGRKIYVEGRLATRTWQAQDGAQRTRTEIVIDDMILLDNKMQGGGIRAEGGNNQSSTDSPKAHVSSKAPKPVTESADKEKEEEKVTPVEDIDVPPDDIPF